MYYVGHQMEAQESPEELSEKVRLALKAVIDPAYGKPMTELGLLQMLEAPRGRALRLKVSLCSGAASFRNEVQASIEHNLRKLDLEPVMVWNLAIPSRGMTGEDPMPRVKNIVLVMSGKGGVGKSSAAANLSLALAKGGAQVGLLDADIYGPSMPLMFGVKDPVRSKDGKTIEPHEAHGIKLMSIGFMLEDDKQAVIWRGPMLHGALQQLMREVNWGELDYLVMDLPPGTGDVALTVAQRASVTGCVMVTTPQEVALADVYKSVSMAQKLNIPILGVLENMSFFIDSAGVRQELFGRGGGAKIAEFAQTSVVGQIPLDPSVREWADAGTPVVKAMPSSAAAQAYQAVADLLAIRIAQHHFMLGGGEKAPAAEPPTRLKIVRS